MPSLNSFAQNDEEKIESNDLDLEEAEEQQLISGPNTTLVVKRKNGLWVKIYDTCCTLAEISNVGIVIEILSKWIPSLLSFTFFSVLTAFADPLIYLWRGLGSLHRVIGRGFFGVVFEGEEAKNKNTHIVADIVKLCFFALSIACFFGAIATGPLGTFLAWSTALCGLGVAAYFDYHYSTKTAKNTCDELTNDPNANPAQVKEAQEDYQNKKYSRNLYVTILIGLAFLLICGSAAAFAPPALVPILYIASKVASGFLALVNVGRVVNWASTVRKKPELITTEVESQEVSPLPAKRSSNALINNALYNRRNSDILINIPELTHQVSDGSSSPTPLDPSLGLAKLNAKSANDQQHRSQSAPSVSVTEVEPISSLRMN